MKKIILSALAIAAMVSCSKTDTGQAPGDDTPNAIVFGSSIETDTKRTDNSAAFDEGEKIGVFGYRMNNPGTTTNFTSDLFLTKTEFTYSGTRFTSTNAAAVWELDKAHNFYAYYPVGLNPTNNTTGATAPLTVVDATGIDATKDVMIANVETPRYVGKNNSAALIFKHVLSKVRFRIKKELSTTPNAVLNKVEFKMKSKTGSVNLVTGAVAKTTGSVTMSKSLTLNINSTIATDIPGSWLVLPADEISDMIMTIDGQPMRVINAGATVPTQAGKFATITITFKASGITFTSRIDPWSDDLTDAPDLKPEYPNPVLEYGVAPYDKKGSVTTPTRTSHNGKSGAGVSNGAYQTDAYTVYANEPPYYKFEVAQTDAYVNNGSKAWAVLQGNRADRSDNICEMTHGEGWRIPRVSEMKLIWENRDALNAPGKGFTAMTGSYYWTATEGSSINAWYVNFASGDPTSYSKTDATNNVRCIKELP